MAMMTRRLNPIAENNKRIEAESARLMGELSDKRYLVAALTQEIDKLTEQNKTFDYRIKSLKIEEDNLKKVIENHKTRVTELEKESADKIVNIQNLFAKQEGLRIKIEEYQSKIISLDKDMQIKVLRDSDMNARLYELDMTIAGLNQQKTELLDKIDGYNAYLIAKKAELEESELKNNADREYLAEQLAQLSVEKGRLNLYIKRINAVYKELNFNIILETI